MNKLLIIILGFLMLTIQSQAFDKNPYSSDTVSILLQNELVISPLYFPLPQMANDSINLCEQAKTDSKQYYKPRGAFGISFLLTVVGLSFLLSNLAIVGVLLLGGAILLLFVKPSPNKLNIPTSSYSSVPEYEQCYTEAATKRKRRRHAWGMITGLIAYLIAIFVLFVLIVIAFSGGI